MTVQESWMTYAAGRARWPVITGARGRTHRPVVARLIAAVGHVLVLARRGSVSTTSALTAAGRRAPAMLARHRTAIHTTVGFAALTAAAWTIAVPFGLAVLGVSSLVMERLGDDDG